LEATLGPSSLWTETYSHAIQTGIGEYLVAPGTPVGAQDSGVIRVEWDQWDGDPATCNCSPAQFSQDLPFQVTVASTPEPDLRWIAALGSPLLILGRRWKRKH
jgi:hypothetical protein